MLNFILYTTPFGFYVLHIPDILLLSKLHTITYFEKTKAYFEKIMADFPKTKADFQKTKADFQKN